jgi:hypothetical protein
MNTEPRNTVKSSTGTRDAVETAIDLSKEDKSTTWEASASKVLRRITQWGAIEPACEANAKQPLEADRA